MIVSIVRFVSGLPDDEVQARFEGRADRFRRVPGLLEKLYLRYRDTGEFGAVYVWESEDALKRFRQSELGQSIGMAYEVRSGPDFELADVRLLVQVEEELHASSDRVGDRAGTS